VEGVLLSGLLFESLSGYDSFMLRGIAGLTLAAAIAGAGMATHANGSTNLTIDAGHRAVVISSDAATAGVNIQPGDSVELFATYQDPRTNQSQTKMILQDVLVMAVQTNKASVDFGITLAVKLEQVELVQMADRARALSIRPAGTPAPPIPRFFLDARPLRKKAQKHLQDRYPNLNVSRLVYLGTMTNAATGVTVVFADSDSLMKNVSSPKTKEETVPVTYAIQYFVRLEPDGELIGIERQERDDGILKISPAPDRIILPPIRIPLTVPTNTIIIIPPERVPQTAP
jgi:Flp pilus assembly protein RcpC/CpaB